MPKAHSLKEWIKIYEEKTGDNFDLPEGYRLFYFELGHIYLDMAEL